MRYLNICILIVAISLSSSCLNKDSNFMQEEIDNMLSSMQSNMIYVEGNTFVIGDSGDGEGIGHFTNIEELHYTNEISLHSYYISKYEVTWKQYITYLNYIGEIEKEIENPLFKRLKSSNNPASTNYVERPALALNWDHAYQFCEWVGKRLSEKYSLPTEAQWEFAARSGGKKIRYASGDPSSLELDNYMKGEYYIRNPITKAKELVVANDPIAKPKGNAYGHFLTQYESAIDYPAVEYYRNVGSYPPNELGIYDMTGNASEWTLDWYQPKYYPIMSKDNPRGPVGSTSDVETALGSDKRVPQKVVRDHVTGNTLPGTSESTLYIRSGSPINDYRIGFRCVKNIYSETP